MNDYFLSLSTIIVLLLTVLGGTQIQILMNSNSFDSAYLVDHREKAN